MGAAKLLLEVGGQTLIRRTVDAVLGSGAWPVVVVLGSDADLVRAQIAGLGVVEARNEAWSTGMASSIRAGISAVVAADPSAQAVLVTPCDLPALSAEAIRLLAGAHRRTGLVAAARYGGRTGAPAVFGRGDFRALGELQGDEGARRLLNSDPAKVAAVDLPDLALDIDTPSDYEAWRDHQK